MLSSKHKQDICFVHDFRKKNIPQCCCNLCCRSVCTVVLIYWDSFLLPSLLGVFMVKCSTSCQIFGRSLPLQYWSCFHFCVKHLSYLVDFSFHNSRSFNTWSDMVWVTVEPMAETGDDMEQTISGWPGSPERQGKARDTLCYFCDFYFPLDKKIPPPPSSFSSQFNYSSIKNVRALMSNHISVTVFTV